jgi:pyruvate dehydrogenase E1 component alpha subunit
VPSFLRKRTVEVEVAIARDTEPLDSSLEIIGQLGLGRDELIGMYRNMLITRGIEERGHILNKQGKIPGSFFTGRGNEAAAVGVATAMQPDDAGTPLHRDMGVHVVRGIEPWRILAQYLGRVGGPARGRDGNVHMAQIERNLVAMVSHLPAMMPVAVGLALAFRIRGEPRVAVSWYGDGASARGDAHEAMNFAGVRRLPVVFVCDNNQYAYSTPAHLEFACANLADRAAGYGFEGVVVDGTDILAVYTEAKRALEKARAGGGPTLVECLTFRMEGHAVHDDASYAPSVLFEEWLKYDPIERFRLWLSEHVQLGEAEQSEIEAEVKALLRAAQEQAESSPFPDPAELEQGVYAEPEELQGSPDA